MASDGREGASLTPPQGFDRVGYPIGPTVGRRIADNGEREGKDHAYGVHIIGAGAMADGDKLVAVAQQAEQLGYRSLWISMSSQPLGQPIAAETVEQYHELGVHLLLVPRAYRGDLPALPEQLAQFNDTVKRPAEQAVGRM
jgi:hypothetical protein